jgi:glycosyltransferase involved in cell wall biosynthesis
MGSSLENKNGASDCAQFSVVIPTFNRLGMLLEALGSVDAQTYRNYEIIVSDDGSTDGTLDYLRSVRPDIRVVEAGGKGAGGARNAGILAAKGKYICLLDSDDLWHPQMLEAVASTLKDCPVAALVVVAESRFKDAEGPPPFQPLKGKVKAEHYDTLHALASSCPGFTGTAVWGALSRDAFLQVGPFHEDRSINMEDLDWLLLAGTEGPAARIANPPLLAYRLHGTQITKDPMQFYRAVQWFLTREKTGQYPVAFEADRKDLIAKMVALPIKQLAGPGTFWKSLRLIWEASSSLGWQALLPHLPRHLAYAVRTRLCGAKEA